MKPPAFWLKRSPSIAARLLQPIAAAYGRITLARMGRSGYLAPLPVICVGNFTLGGAGKTPTAIAIARALQAEGEIAVFLTRGYGGALRGPVVVSDAHLARDVGDEPLLLSRVARTIVSRDRSAGVPLAVAQGATVIVLDDGLQNPALAKTFSLAVVDGGSGFGNGLSFPAGPLRAPVLHQSRHVDAVLTLGDGVGTGDAAQLSAASSKPAFSSHLIVPPEITAQLNGQRVLAFAGIGRPQKFSDTLRAIGCDVAETIAFGDHHAFTEADSEELMTRASAASALLVTTEKDHVRLVGTPALAALKEAALPVPVSLPLPSPLLALIKARLSAFRARASTTPQA